MQQVILNSLHLWQFTFVTFHNRWVSQRDWLAWNVTLRNVTLTHQPFDQTSHTLSASRSSPGCWRDDCWKAGFLQRYDSSENLQTASESCKLQTLWEKYYVELTVAENRRSHPNFTMYSSIKYFTLPHSCGVCFCQKPFIGRTSTEPFIVQTWLWQGCFWSQRQQQMRNPAQNSSSAACRPMVHIKLAETSVS